MKDSWTHGAIAEAMRGMLESGNPQATWEPGRVSIDSRSLCPGDIFFAIRGDRDGHDFITDAAGRGASGVVIEEGRTSVPTGTSLAIFRVRNTTEALSEWASAHRACLDTEVIVVTGSSGKTTTKDRLAEILARRAPTHSTEGNLNNHLGVPLTLLALRSDHRYAVVEVAMNHPGEIEPLSRLARPKHVVITTIGWAHIGALGTREAIMREKLSAVRGMLGGGILFHEHDAWFIDRLSDDQKSMRRVTFGLTPEADCHPDSIDWRASGTTFTSGYTGAVDHPCPGRSSLKAAIAACAVSSALGVPGPVAREALQAARPRTMRMEPRRLGSALAVLDCYNASPESSLEVVYFLSQLKTPGRRWLAFGEMRELGARSEEAHRRLGEAAGSMVDGAFFLGEACRPAYEAYLESAGGRGVASLHPIGEHEAIARDLVPRLGPEDVVVFKGSRFSSMERSFQACERLIMGTGGLDRAR